MVAARLLLLFAMITEFTVLHNRVWWWCLHAIISMSKEIFSMHFTVDPWQLLPWQKILGQKIPWQLLLHQIPKMFMTLTIATLSHQFYQPTHGKGHLAQLGKCIEDLKIELFFYIDENSRLGCYLVSLVGVLFFIWERPMCLQNSSETATYFPHRPYVANLGEIVTTDHKLNMAWIHTLCLIIYFSYWRSD